MKKLFYLFILFSMSLNAQIINLKILDFDNLPLDDADIYFKTSTKNFISDMQGKAIANWKVTDKEQTNIKIQVQSMSSGVYIVKLKTVKGNISKKIIVR